VHPDRIGPYRVESRLGAGGMGTVYLGIHDTTGDRAAVKVLPASLAREEGFVARFEREVQALQKLSNPHIVEFLEGGVDDEGRHYYAMEYVEGETLTARLHRERRLPWRETIEIAIQICVALKAAHNAGVIHRDLKPSNLLLAPNGTVKLTDFGIAHVFAGTQLTAPGSTIGTAEFMSPEQAEGRHVTKQSDLYSLGAVMYTMLTGRPPYTGKTARAVIQMHLVGQFDRPRNYVPDLPVWLDDVVCELLERDPAKRPPDAYVLQRRLETILARVELAASQDATRTAVAGSGPSDDTVAQFPDSGPRGPGAATLMRDLVKAEVERTQQKSPLGRAFDNTWVLVGLLVLVVGFTVWMWRNSGLSPEQHFKAGVAALEQPAGPAWLEARREHFDPLLEADEETWGPRLRPHLERIAAYEFARNLERNPRLRPATLPANAAQRFVLQAERERDAGNLAAAERTLVTLRRLLVETGTHGELLDVVDGRLAELRERSEQRGDDALVTAALARAEEHLESSEVAAARALLADLTTLYADDPAIITRIDDLRSRIELEVNEHP
jgi:predicted Ser/Thr protein kinase